MKIVDTTVLIDHARGDSEVGKFLTDHDAETLLVPAIVFLELAVWEVAARGESKEAVLSHIGRFDVRAFDADHAYHAAVIEADLRSAGEYTPRLARDVLIGGVARSIGVPIVTRHVEHFERFDGVTVETY